MTLWLEDLRNSDFSIANIPFGRVSINGMPTVVSRIGDHLILLDELTKVGKLPKVEGIQQGNIVPSIGAYRSLRFAIKEWLSELESPKSEFLLPLDSLEMLMPIRPPAYVDFYSGIHHASNVGKMFRPDSPPLLPNYRHVPIAYNGRASTVNTDGIVRRPSGQVKPNPTDPPVFIPTNELDFELEMAFYLAAEAESRTLTIENCRECIFGFVLLNDWSARDVQRWEYQPLGPFLAKSFSTTISPWILFIDAVQPLICEGMPQTPAPLEYLKTATPLRLNMDLEVTLKTRKASEPQVISRTNSRELYWGFDQQLAHQACNGTVFEAGDLYASGTISNEKPHENGLGAFGSMLELTWRGQQPLHIIETGESRTFLQDGDEVTFTGGQITPEGQVGFGNMHGIIHG